MQDFRYAFRTFRKQPTFTLAVLATLSLGIGANAAVFSLLDQVLLRPLPYADEHRLVFVWNRYGEARNQTDVSIPDYLDRRSDAPAIDDAALFTTRALALTGTGSSPEPLRALAVTPSFFTTLGRAPMLGRPFTEEEAKPGADRFLVLSYAFWASHLASNAGIVGRDLELDGTPWRVVGVMPEDFEAPARDIAVFVPFAFTQMQRSDQERGNEFSSMIARLRPGATPAQLDSQMDAIVLRTMDRVPARAAYMRNSRFGGVAVPMREQLVGDFRRPLIVLQAAVTLVLLIACANVSNLLLMFANRRSRELAIRSALGAGRQRIVRQLVTEGVMLSAGGAVGGLALATAGVRLLTSMSADQTLISLEPSLGWPVMAFTAVLSFTTALLFGLAPALGLGRGLAFGLLKDDSVHATAGRRTGAVRTVLVVAETALALMLLAGAGLLIKSFARLLTVDPGFSTERVLTAQIALPPARYSTDVQVRGFQTSLLERLQGMPDIAAAGLTTSVPFSGRPSGGTYRVVQRDLGPNERPLHAQQDIVGGDYFRALQIPLLEGRVFTGADSPDRPRVVIVDALLARRQFPGRSPIGQFLNFGGPRNYEIVGVVGTVNAADLALPVPEERVYFSLTQLPSPTIGLVVKSRAEAGTLAAEVRAAVEAVDKAQPLADVRTMDQWVARSLQPRRAPMALLGAFGALALALAAVGIYGVLAFGVTVRMREFGIRQALGASRQSILTLVLREGLTTAGIGVVVGLAGCLAGTRYLQSMLYGVTSYDATVLAGVSVLLLLVAAAASMVPAIGATAADPTLALRDS